MNDAADLIKDFVVVGYPKVGNTLVHMLLLRALGMPLSSWSSIFFTHNIPNLNRPGSENEPQSFDIISKFARVLLLVRHPGPVIVSNWYHNRFRETIPLTEKPLSEVLDDPLYGINRFFRYYQEWNEWVTNGNDDQQVMIQHYEIFARSGHSRRRMAMEVLPFIGFKPDPQLVDSAVDETDPKAMADREASGGYDMIVPLRRSRNYRLYGTKTMKTRAPWRRPWREELGREASERVDREYEERMPPIFKLNFKPGFP